MPRKLITTADVQAYLSAKTQDVGTDHLRELRRTARELGMVEEMFKNLLNDRRGFWRKIYREEILVRSKWKV